MFCMSLSGGNLVALVLVNVNLFFVLCTLTRDSTCMYFQRTHGLFGNRVDSFSSSEPAIAQSQQMASQRPLQFSESQPESPPNSAGLVPATEFFPTASTKSNTNNNAFAE